MKRPVAHWLPSPLLMLAVAAAPCYASIRIQVEPSVVTENYVYLRGHIAEPGYARVDVYDIAGSWVRTQRVLAGGGGDIWYVMPAYGLSSGEYLVKLSAGGEQAFCRFARVDKDMHSGRPAMTAMNRWPSARVASLAGAAAPAQSEVAVLADNPAQFYLHQKAVTGGINITGLLPTLQPGWASISAEVRYSRRATTACLYLVYNSYGESEVVNERGEVFGRRSSRDLQCGTEASVALIGGKIVLGGRARYVAGWLVPQWVWGVMPELGMLASGGTASGLAVDVGACYNPSSKLSVGLSLNHWGTGLDYVTGCLFSLTGDDREPFPTTLRLGLRYSPVQSERLTVSISPEVDKVLVGMFSDTTGTKSFGQQLQAEWRSALKSIGLEGTYRVNRLALSVRLGYLEDLSSHRGGFVYVNDDEASHLGLGEVMAAKDPGTLTSLGICYGIGIQYGWLRLDLSNSLVSDVSASDYSLSLVYTGE